MQTEHESHPASSRANAEGCRRHRIEFARDIHERVIPSLQATALRLDSGDVSPTELRTCVRQIKDAVGELRGVIVSRPSAISPHPAALGELIHRIAEQHRDLALHVNGAVDPLVPAALVPLVEHFLAESLANAERHARPLSVVLVAEQVGEALRIDVENDGVYAHDAPGTGLRLLAEHALERDAIVDWGSAGLGRWRTTLVIPMEVESL